MQSKKHSWHESWINTGVGMIISVVIQAIAYPAVTGNPLTFKQNLTLLFIFTVVSVLRNYFIRRYFNWKTKREIYAENH